MDAVVVGDHDAPAAHPGKSAVERGVVDIHRSPGGARTAEKSSLSA